MLVDQRRLRCGATEAVHRFLEGRAGLGSHSGTRVAEVVEAQVRRPAAILALFHQLPKVRWWTGLPTPDGKRSPIRPGWVYSERWVSRSGMRAGGTWTRSNAGNGPRDLAAYLQAAEVRAKTLQGKRLAAAEEWLGWGRSYLRELDPLNRALRMPPDPTFTPRSSSRSCTACRPTG